MPTPSPSGSSPESLFAAWLDRVADGEARDIEALCREHVAAAPALRELYGHWLKIEEVVRQFGLGRSLADRLASRFGSDVDPQVTLEGEGQAQSDFSSEILSRLGDRGQASTRYRIQGEVAHGGMGAVLRVWDLDLRRHLAMKVMLGQGVARPEGEAPKVDPRLLARFLEEAQVTGQLDHPGIVPVHELGLDAEGRVYFTMKLVQGQTLKDVFDEFSKGEGGWTQTRVLGLILKVCEAMSYAHAKGVIHRDLKPANVMVGKYGEVYVMDWGLSKILGRGDERDIRIRDEPVLATGAVRSLRSDRLEQSPDSPLYTMDGDVVGTPAYMSPEQALGRVSEMGPPSDVYAVGAMLYHLLAGHMPYVAPGARLNNYAVWSQVQAGPPRSLEEFVPQTPAELAAICEKAMARAKEARYASTKELGEDLAAYVEGRVVGAYETGAWAEAHKWVRRNRPLAASLAAVVVLALGGLASTIYVQAKGRAAERIQSERADAKAQEAQQNLVLSQRNEAEAKAQREVAVRERERAESVTAKVLRLSDVKVLQQLEEEADKLWPAHPDRIPALQSWLDQAGALAGNLPGHRATLAEMRGGALPWSKKEQTRDRETHPRVGDLAEKQAELAGLIAQLEHGLAGEAQATADQRVTELEPEIAELADDMLSRRTWSFDTTEDQWQHDVLAELIVNLEGLVGGLLADDVITADHGWSVPKRMGFARKLEVAFAPGGACAEKWTEALPALREAYHGLDLKPQMGLFPVGPDPESGLWEFTHLMTGEPPARGPDGKLLLTEGTGVTLVLLPGGSFWMGAQSFAAAGRNYDPQADIDEAPVHPVELSAFFLSKHELTQGQWLRLSGHNPSAFRSNNPNSGILLKGQPPSLLHPVEQVSWDDCMAWLPRAGLLLPSEAQWEYAARGGTTTPWWTGSEKETLAGAANLMDRYAHTHGAPNWVGIEQWLDDGATLQAPIGTYRANAFGLHEVAGNLGEWCLDGYDAGYYARCPRLDPLSPWEGAASRVYRSGHFSFAAILARSAARNDGAPFNAISITGVRPAQAIKP